MECPAAWKEVGKVLISKEGAQLVTHSHIDRTVMVLLALRKGCAGYASGLIRDIEVRLRVKRHCDLDSDEGAVTRIIRTDSEFANSVYPESPPSR